MVQRRSSLRFLHESLHPIRMSSDISRQNLERNFTIQFCVLREIHLTHSAFANLCADFIAAQMCTGRKGHGERAGCVIECLWPKPGSAEAILDYFGQLR